jgi:hypothetical protein
VARAGYEEGTVSGFISDRPLARGLIRSGDEAIAHEDDAKLRDYFAEDYLFHDPAATWALTASLPQRRVPDGVVAARRGCPVTQGGREMLGTRWP